MIYVCVLTHTHPVYQTPGGENNFTCIQTYVQHFGLVHAVIDVKNNK